MEQTRGRSPEGFKIDVSVGEVVSRKSEKRKRTARREVNADENDFLAIVGSEGTAVCPGDDRTGESQTFGGALGIDEPKFVPPEIDGKFEGTGRENAFGLLFKAAIFEDPEGLDEFRKRRFWFVEVKDLVDRGDRELLGFAAGYVFLGRSHTNILKYPKENSSLAVIF